MPSIARQHWFSKNVGLLTSEGASGFVSFPFGDFAGGKIYIPVASSITTLTFYSAAAQAGRPTPDNLGSGAPVFTQCYDKTNTALSLTVAAGRNYPLPDELFGDGVVEIVANAAGNVDVSLKA